MQNSIGVFSFFLFRSKIPFPVEFGPKNENCHFKLKFNIKANPNMCILMNFKIQSDQPSLTRNALKCQIFNLFTKSSSGHNLWTF